MANEKRKLTVSLSSDVVEVLKELADANGSTMTEELRRAISDRKFFTDHRDRGDKIVLENDAQRTYVEFR